MERPVEVALISPDELVRLTRGDRHSKNLKTRQAEQTEQAPVRKEAKTPLVKTVPPPAAAEPPPAEQADRIEEKLAALQEPPKPAGPTPEELAAKAAAEKAAAELALKTAAAEEKARQAAADEKRRQAEADAERKRKAEDKRRKERARKKALEREKKLAEMRRRERERKEKAFDPGRISALLNKIPDSKAPAAGSPEPAQDRRLPQGARAGAPEGRDSQLTASQASLLGAMMKTAVSRCWNINSGLEGVDRIVVDIEIKLGTDGRLRGQPKVATRGSGALFQDAANNAMRALVQCEPYELPPKLYKGGWDHMIVRFDPQKMF